MFEAPLAPSFACQTNKAGGPLELSNVRRQPSHQASAVTDDEDSLKYTSNGNKLLKQESPGPRRRQARQGDSDLTESGINSGNV